MKRRLTFSLAWNVLLPGLAVHLRRLPRPPASPRAGRVDEPSRRLPRHRPCLDLLRVAEVGPHLGSMLLDSLRGRRYALRQHRDLLQPPPALVAGLPDARRVRGATSHQPDRTSSGLTLTECPPLRGQIKGTLGRGRQGGGWGALVRGHLNVVELDSEWHMGILEVPRPQHLATELRRRMDALEEA